MIAATAADLSVLKLNKYNELCLCKVKELSFVWNEAGKVLAETEVRSDGAGRISGRLLKEKLKKVRQSK